MKAITYHQYGSPEVLNVEEVSKPAPKENEILIKLMATTVNSGDVRLRSADPWMVRLVFGAIKPKNPTLGMVFAGIVEEVGSGVAKYKVEDKVFGINVKTLGCFAEYVVISDDTPMALMPKNCTFEEAAATIFGGHTALHFLKKAKIIEGHKILIYGASGAVGTSAIQLAKYYGAEVTAVTSSSNFELAKKLGAYKVIDYTDTNWLETIEKYDVVYETVNKTAVFEIAKLLKTNGTLILGAVIIKGMIEGYLATLKFKIRLIGGVADVTSKDIETLKELIENGNLKPVIDKTFELEQMAEAHEYADQGHKKGNVAISVNH
jgi:NADPH:quinone reductase-like Zn-dependent oxidoreductase